MASPNWKWNKWMTLYIWPTSSYVMTSRLNVSSWYPILVQSVKNPMDPFASATQSLHLISNRGCTADTLPRVPHLRIYRLTKTHLGIWSGAIKIPSKISQYQGSIYYNTDYSWALSYYSDLTLSQEFQPMAAQLSMKAALPLAKILATASCRSSKTGPWALYY